MMVYFSALMLMLGLFLVAAAIGDVAKAIEKAAKKNNRS